jgi:hypothetical protein
LQQHNKNDRTTRGTIPRHGTVLLSSKAGDVARSNMNALAMWLAVRCSMLLALVLLLLLYSFRTNRQDDDDDALANPLHTGGYRQSERHEGLPWPWQGMFGRRVQDRATRANGSTTIDEQLAVAGADRQYNRL